MFKPWSVSLVAVFLLLGACSSGSSNDTDITLAPATTSAGASSETSEGTSEAPETTVATTEPEPESPDDLQEFARVNANTRLASGGSYLPQQALASAQPAGRIIELRCSVSLCDEVGSGIAEAAALLGWSHEVLDLGSTRESVEGTWLVVAEQSPTIVPSGIPTMVIAAASAPEWSSAAIQTILDNGVPVLTYGGAEGDSALGVTTQVLEESEFYRRGALMADIALSEGEGAIRFLAVDSLPLISVMRQGFEDELARICFEDCSLEIVPNSIDDLIRGAAIDSILEAAAVPDPPVVVVALEQALAGGAEALGTFEGELPLVVTQGSGLEVSALTAAGVRMASVGSSAVAA
ncbi:MAG: hypothetical protein ACC652_06615, partial [Acidimicrobiales bacterium]